MSMRHRAGGVRVRVGMSVEVAAGGGLGACEDGGTEAG